MHLSTCRCGDSCSPQPRRRTLQIRSRTPQRLGVEPADDVAVTRPAQNSSPALPARRRPGTTRVVVVDGQGLRRSGRPTADVALPALPLEHGPVLVRGDAVGALHVGVAGSGLAGSFAARVWVAQRGLRTPDTMGRFEPGSQSTHWPHATQNSPPPKGWASCAERLTGAADSREHSTAPHQLSTPSCRRRPLAWDAHRSSRCQRGEHGHEQALPTPGCRSSSRTSWWLQAHRRWSGEAERGKLIAACRPVCMAWQASATLG